MADTPISRLPLETAPALTDFIVGDFGSTPRTKRVTVAALLSAVDTSGISGTATAAVALLQATPLCYIKSNGTLDLANATAEGKEALVFVNDDFQAGNVVTYYTTGLIDGFVGLTPGTDYFMSAATSGAVTATAPTTAGNVVQRIGVAVSSTAISFSPATPITLS